MSNLATKLTEDARAYHVKLPPLHEGRKDRYTFSTGVVEPLPKNEQGGQVAIVNHPARFKVVICGRRWGKTTLGVWLCLRDALRGKRLWWVAPTYKVAFVGWRLLKQLSVHIPGAEIREGDRVVFFPDGGEVWIKSADDPDSLRGEGLDGIVLDEVAQIKPVAWTEALRPALGDRQGWALFIGTPKGRNWVWNLWQRAATTPGWARWRKFSTDNPHVPLEEIEAAKKEYEDKGQINVFKQEYEADFGASQLQVYEDFDRVLHQWKWEIPQFEYYIGGLDFGGTTIGSHKSAGIFGGVTRGDMLVELFEFEDSGPNVTERQVNWMAECEAKAHIIARRAGRRRVDTLLWRADKSQSAFIQVARSAGYSILPSKGGPDSVRNGVGLVQRRLAVRGDGYARLYYSPDLRYFPDALERYRYPDIPEDEERLKSPNPLKVNDDMADSVRYQVEGLDLFTTGDPVELYGATLPVII